MGMDFAPHLTTRAGWGKTCDVSESLFIVENGLGGTVGGYI